MALKRLDPRTYQTGTLIHWDQADQGNLIHYRLPSNRKSNKAFTLLVIGMVLCIALAIALTVLATQGLVLA